MEQTTTNSIIGVVIVVLAIWGVTSLFNKKPTVKVSATEVQVSRFYNGEEGYSLSIPTGNTSTCTWTWTGGNAQIPNSQTTFASTATSKHTLGFPNGTLSFNSDFKVSCVDDFGSQYIGLFPSK